MRLLPLLALLPLAACAPNPNMTLSPRQQIRVERTDHAIDLAAGPTGLPTGERARLAAWLDALAPNYGDALAVDDAWRRSAVRDDIARIAGERGILLAPAAPVTPGEVRPGDARVVLTRSTANLAGCPDFRYEDLPRQAPETSRNYGCASNGNLAAMIADPQDLVRGRSTPLGDPQTTVRAVTSWQKKALTGDGALKAEAAGGGK